MRVTALSFLVGLFRNSKEGGYFNKMVKKEDSTPENPQETPEDKTQDKTYTQEELDAFTKTAKEEAEAEAWEKYQGIQKTLNEKDLIIKGLQSKPQPPTTSTPPTTSLMLGLMKKQAEDSGDQEALARISQIEVATQQEQARLDYQARLKQQQAETNQKREEFEQKIKQAGLDPTDEMFDPTWDAFELADMRDGNWGKAENRLDRILSKNKPEGAKGETEEQMRERIERETQEKLGLNKPEGAKPSGSSTSIPTNIEEFRKWIASMSQEEYEENYAAEVNKMRRQGEIK